jgi:hypothetical protein
MRAATRRGRTAVERVASSESGKSGGHVIPLRPAAIADYALARRRLRTRNGAHVARQLTTFFDADIAVTDVP